MKIILWRSFRNYEVNDDKNKKNNNPNIRINNGKTITSKNFKYKTIIMRRTPDDNNTFDTEIAVPIKYLSNFWRFLDLTLVNCEKELDLP